MFYIYVAYSLGYVLDIGSTCKRTEQSRGTISRGDAAWCTASTSYTRIQWSSTPVRFSYFHSFPLMVCGYVLVQKILC